MADKKFSLIISDIILIICWYYFFDFSQKTMQIIILVIIIRYILSYIIRIVWYYIYRKKAYSDYFFNFLKDNNFPSPIDYEHSDNNYYWSESYMKDISEWYYRWKIRTYFWEDIDITDKAINQLRYHLFEKFYYRNDWFNFDLYIKWFADDEWLKKYAEYLKNKTK